jgi:hypothetical protein
VDDGLRSRRGGRHLAYIAKLDLGEPDLRPWQRWGPAIGGDHFVIVSKKLVDHRLAELAAGAGDQDTPAPH